MAKSLHLSKIVCCPDKNINLCNLLQCHMCVPVCDMLNVWLSNLYVDVDNFIIVHVIDAVLSVCKRLTSKDYVVYK